MEHVRRRRALQQALAAWDVYERLGSPEGGLAIARAVVYLATAPKSIAVYRSRNAARRAARRTGSLMRAAHILSAPTRLMKDLGYGKDYRYDPDAAAGFSGADHFPDGVDHGTGRHRRRQCHPCPTCDLPAGSGRRTDAGKTAAKYHTRRLQLVPRVAEELGILTPPDPRPRQAVVAGSGTSSDTVEGGYSAKTRQLTTRTTSRLINITHHQSAR